MTLSSEASLEKMTSILLSPFTSRWNHSFTHLVFPNPWFLIFVFTFTGTEHFGLGFWVGVLLVGFFVWLVCVVLVFFVGVNTWTVIILSPAWEVICASKLSGLVWPAIKLKMHANHFPRMALRSVSYLLHFCWWALWLFACFTLMLFRSFWVLEYWYTFGCLPVHCQLVLIIICWSQLGLTVLFLGLGLLCFFPVLSRWCFVLL